MQCDICYQVEAMGRWVWNVGILLCDLYLNKTETPPGLLVNVSGVLPGHIIALFLYYLPALGSISMIIFMAIIKWRMDY